MQAEAVEAEALRRSDELKTALLRSISHDLRTPLTSIIAGGSALGSETLTAEERAELSAAIVGEGNRLSRLVENLLDMSRLEAGKAEPHRGLVDLAEVLEAARAACRAGSIRLAVDARPADGRRRCGAAGACLREPVRQRDPSQRRPACAGPLPAGRRAVVGPRRRSGTGHTRERVGAHLRAVPTRQQRPSDTGSGLGLAIVKGFVEANGGEIAHRVAARPGDQLRRHVSAAGERRHERGDANPGLRRRATDPSRAAR